MPEGPYNTQLTAQYISATYDRAVEVAASQSAKVYPLSSQVTPTASWSI